METMIVDPFLEICVRKRWRWRRRRRGENESKCKLTSEEPCFCLTGKDEALEFCWIIR